MRWALPLVVVASAATICWNLAPLARPGHLSTLERPNYDFARYLAHRGAPTEAPLTASERRAFAAVERRLRDFAELPYATAATRAGRGASAA